MKYNKNYLLRRSVSFGVPANTEGTDGDIRVCYVSNSYALYVKANNQWQLASSLKTTDKNGNINFGNNLTYLNRFIFVDKNKIGVSSRSGIGQAKIDRLILDANTFIKGSLKVNSIAASGSDTDKFLVSDSGVIKYRTGAQILSDLGIAADEIIDWTTDQGSDNIHASNMAAAQTDITSIYNTSLAIGRDSTDQIDFSSDNQIRFKVGDANEVILNVNSLYPAVNDGTALGGTSNNYSDLYLASGGVINWDNGNTTLTHAAGKLTLNNILEFGSLSDGTITITDFVDEDNMASNSAVKIPTQQSVKAYVDSEITGLVDSAPGALDTLNELAAALGDDASFATTVTNSIATKVSLTGNETIAGQKTFSQDGDPSVIIQDPNGSNLLRLLRTDTSARFDISLEGSDLRFTPNTTDGTQNVLIGVNAGSSTIDSRLGVGDATPSEMLSVTGNIAVSGTVDGRDVAADGVLATNALPKAGGTLTGDLTINSPASKLILSGDDTSENHAIESDANLYLTIDKDADDTSNFFQFRSHSGGTLTEIMRIKDTGEVGIGTTSPSYSLHVKGGRILIDGDGSNSMLSLQNATANRFSNIVNTGGDSDSTIAFQVGEAGSPTEAMIIHEDGRVGIGVSSPASLLHVDEGDIRIDTASGATQALRFSETSTTKAQVQYRSGDEEFNLITVDASGTAQKRVTIKSEQDATAVGIGNNSPAQALDVTGNIAVTGTVDGRDLQTDGTKLDGIEASADVTDTTNVLSALSGDLGGNYDIGNQTSDTATFGGPVKVEHGGWNGITVENTANTNGSHIELKNTERRFQVAVRSNGFDIRDVTASDTSRFSINSSGNITIGGTIDGRDLATDGTKLDGIESSATADQTAVEIIGLLNSDLGGNFTIGNQSDDSATFSGDVIISGDLTVNGGDMLLDNLTTSKALIIKASDDESAAIEFHADDASDNQDKWQIEAHKDDGDLYFYNMTSGSWAQKFRVTDTGNAVVNNALFIGSVPSGDGSSENVLVFDSGTSRVEKRTYAELRSDLGIADNEIIDWTAGSAGTIDASNIPTLNQDTTGTAAIATTVTVADESSDTTCFPLFATGQTGNLAPKSGSNLTFNSSTGLLSATQLAGDHAATNIGHSGNLPLAGAGTDTNTAAEYVALPLGYHGFMHANLGTDEGMPENNYMFFHKFGHRDTDGGWGGLAVKYNDGSHAYFGTVSDATSGDNFATWYKILVQDGSNNVTVDNTLTVSTSIQLGHASDTTLTRASAGNVNIEGNLVYRAGGTDVPVADGGTGQSTLDNLITLGNHTTGNYVASLTAGNLIDVGGGAEGGTPTIDVDLSEALEASIADGDYILFLDGGASGDGKKEALHDLATLFAGSGLTATNSVLSVDAAQTGITSVGALDSGSITSGFGTIDTGSSTITTTGTVSTGNIAATGTITPSSYIELSGAPSDPGADGKVRLGENGNSLRIYTNYGYLNVGPQNASWSHFYTDRAKYYFNHPITVDEGIISSYNEDVILRRSNDAQNQLLIGDDSLAVTLGGDSRFSIDGSGVVSAVELDISGDVDVDGTLETDALTIGGVTSVPFESADHSKLDGIEASATADQTAGEILTLIEDGVDSVHYKDGSIDHVHLAGDAVDGDNIADNSINSEHYVDGSIDTAHIADDQVTYAKIQNVSNTNRILGRDSSGAGIIEEISPANLRTMINVADGSEANVSGNNGNAAIYDNSGTPAFKTSITKAEVQSLLNIADGANANVSGDSGNSAIYDNSGTPTLKSGITQGEMQTAIGGVYTDTNTTYSGGTNLTLDGTTFNVDDAFLKNNADDTTSGTITAGGFTTTGALACATIDTGQGATEVYAMNQAVESTDAVEFTGLTLTASSLASAGSDNKVLDITQTLNDSSAAGGIQNYATIKANITATNLGGWDNTNFIKLQNSGTNKFLVDLDGLVTSASDINSGGNIKVGGNVIEASDGTTAITISDSGNVTTGNDLMVTSNNIRNSDGTVTMQMDTSENVQVTGNLSLMTNAVAAAKYISVRASSGTNVVGNRLYIQSGQSTGNANGGGIFFQGSTPGSSGTGVNSYATAASLTTGGVFNASGGYSIGGHVVDDIDLAGEFNDVDDHLMSSAAIQDKILAETTEFRHIINAGFNYGFTGGTRVFIPLVGYVVERSSTSSGTEYIAFVAPYDGYLNQVVFRSEEACGSTVVGLHKSSTGTELPSNTASESITVDMATDDTPYKFAFTGGASGNDNQFSAGQILAISFDPTNDANDTVFTAEFILDSSAGL